MPSAENDNPFTPSDAHVQRIRVRAYHLWESEDRPEGQSAEYWERARELDALESDPVALVPATSLARRNSDGVLIEEAALQENLGEFPSLFSDQGETMPTPESRRIARAFRDGER